MGHLPDLAYVDPHFGNDSSNENDDHPRTDIRIGEVFLNLLYETVTTSPNWPSTVLVINFDEWGGFFDHVPPPVSPLPDADAALGNDGLLGFRVPCLLISPFARRSFISSTLFDHTSILSMIEWRWGLPPLTVRDQNANNLATALDFTHQNLSVPRFLVSMARYGTCKHP
jgi:phospholipase C